MTDEFQVGPDIATLPGDESLSKESPRPYRYSLLGLLMGVLALGLAVVPSMVWDRPLPNPFAETPPPPEPKTQHEGGVTLKIKNFSMTLSGKEVPIKEDKPDPSLSSDPVKWFTISAICIAIASILTASIAQFHEKHTSLTLSAVGLSVAALTWQYIVIGLLIGAAIAVLLFVLIALGGVSA
ncbi:MAG TPA: hypothetical protein DCM28_17920 [Phycisphaerales bacterium]|nr:hypothetical protein [Phycisphaerales bacterium]HCD35034.1 hypothetical protein [Phycisphaerales bacterium]|tara:strand:- start:1717 stop:2262 length:546 start_codon:yes stop_codon:yes gene_type:complete